MRLLFELLKPPDKAKKSLLYHLLYLSTILYASVLRAVNFFDLPSLSKVWVSESEIPW